MIEVFKSALKKIILISHHICPPRFELPKNPRRSQKKDSAGTSPATASIGVASITSSRQTMMIRQPDTACPPWHLKDFVAVSKTKVPVSGGRSDK